MKRKYTVVTAVILIAIYIGGSLIDNKVRQFKFDKLYESYEENYYEVIRHVDRESFEDFMSDEEIVKDIEELDKIVTGMEKYETQDDFFRKIDAQSDITNLVEAVAYVQNWDYLSEEKKNSIINELLMNKSVFLSTYE